MLVSIFYVVLEYILGFKSSNLLEKELKSWQYFAVYSYMIFKLFSVFILMGLFEYKKGDTPFKKMFNLQTIRPNKLNDRYSQIYVYVVRNFVKSLHIYTFFVGYIVILLSKDRKGIHDLIAKTKVVEM